MAENVAAKALPPEDETVFHQLGYTFSKQIGSGSYAKVFLAEMRKGRETKQYACKIINMKDAPAEFTKKFLPRELDILGRVKHPNIIYIQGMFHRSGKILIFMQNAEEGDLLEYILKEQEIPEMLAKLWSHQMIVALQYLHAYRIAHRDIKCENVLITKHMNAKLADFGFARFVVGKTLSKTYCGSIAYAAPEVMKGKPYAPINADIWSLGVVFYVILNRALPFPLEKFTPKQILRMQLTRAWKFRAKAIAKFAPESVCLVQQMLEPDPRKRPTTQALLVKEWFFVRENDKSEKISGLKCELTDDERNALAAAAAANVDVKEDTNLAIIDKFDLLTLKTEPYPSTNVLRPLASPTIKLPMRESLLQEQIEETTRVSPESSLNRIPETINLGNDHPMPPVPPAQVTPTEPTPN